MNILFSLTPKCDVAFIQENDSLRQALEKMEHHRYAAIPILTKDGKYFGTLTEGDLLWEIKNQLNLDLRDAEQIHVKDIPRKNNYQKVGITSSMEDLIKQAMNQNFVPVVDDMDHFIGLVTRRELINYMYKRIDFTHDEDRTADCSALSDGFSDTRTGTDPVYETRKPVLVK